MDATLQFTRRWLVEQTEDVEDLACSFMENEVGRHDWQGNWEVVKSRGNVRERIEDWLDEQNAKSDPQAIIDYLDDLSQRRTGRWR